MKYLIFMILLVLLFGCTKQTTGTSYIEVTKVQKKKKDHLQKQAYD